MNAAALFQAPAASTGPVSAPPASRWPTCNPRERHVLRTLAIHFEGVKREELDRIIGASNSPDLIFRLRRVCGIVIVTESIRCRTAEGRSTHFAVYSLPPQERAKVLEWMAADAA